MTVRLEDVNFPLLLVKQVFTNEDGSTEYRVISTKIVGPKDTSAVDITSGDKLTLITCYPFYYIGPATKRFIVEAKKN